MSRVTSFFCLSSLILINCNIDDHGVQVLIKTKTGTNLEILRLDVNRITDTGVEILFNLVSGCTELQHLSLSCNHIGNKTLGRALDPRANGTWLSKLTE